MSGGVHGPIAVEVEPLRADAHETDAPGIGDLIARLSAQARTWLRATLAMYKLDAGRRAKSAGLAAALFVAALTLAQGALIALLVGLIMLVAQSLWLGWAILIVVGATLALVAVLALVSMRFVRSTTDPDSGK